MKLSFKSTLLSLALLATQAFAVINLNTATKDELMSLNGIGESKAEAIIEYRKANKFNSIEDIKNISGIGDKTYENLKDDISVSGKTTVQPKVKEDINNKASKTKDNASKKGSEIKDIKSSAKDKVKEKAKEEISK
ncbi:helix-hairpin-helix domain-containing protein [Campylobacter sp. RM12920]|uniref:Helix-hairpin-helix domain-containing protein n=1 Tax=Campylobacter californiensis TaxID=1032243 RepID=A0ABD4JL96_9BACT|nr:helix-hairpin-helix domain-containing protein [Campylobacter sp. RM12919]MBE2989012.1 helix-hairpin-helix domain-containing protein [Campylobacter sp. RM12920]